MAIHWQMIKSSDEGRDQASRADAVIHDLKLDLAAVSVTGEAEFNAELGSAMKRIRIVREQKIRHVPANQLRKARGWTQAEMS